MPKGLRIRRDHVIEAMVKGLGCRVIEIEAPFDPEGGAYAASAHDHAHEHHDHTIMRSTTTIMVMRMAMTTSRP